LTNGDGTASLLGEWRRWRDDKGNISNCELRRHQRRLNEDDLIDDGDDDEDARSRRH